MMKTKYLILTLALVAVFSCTEKTAPESPSAGLVLEMAPSLTESPATRGAIFADGSGRMPVRSSYALWICEHHEGSYTDGSNPYTEYALRYNNIQAARADNGVWNYSYYGYTGFPTLYILPKDENHDGRTDVSADIFAYAPYQEAGTPESVSFSVTSATDVMYAAENGVDNLNIDPADIDPSDPRYTATPERTLQVPLHFTHALALLEFDFWVKNRYYNHPDESGNALGYTLNSIKVTRREGGHPLYTSGKMNAMRSGLLYDLTEAGSVTVSNLAPHNGGAITVGAGNYSAATAARAYLLQVPSQTGDTAYADGDYTFEFYFSGQTFPVTFTLLREHIKHADDTYGFQPGYRYTFKFEIDNYVHFEGVTVGEWETVEEPIFQTEI